MENRYNPTPNDIKNITERARKYETVVDLAIKAGQAFAYYNNEAIIEARDQIGADAYYGRNEHRALEFAIRRTKAANEKLREAAREQNTPSDIVPHVADQFEPGAILYTNWGYEQTNVDYWMVTRCTDKTAWIVRMDKNYEQTGYMTGNTSAGDVAHWEDAPLRRKINRRGGRPSITTNYDSATAWLWDGKEKYSSSYA